MGYREKQRPVAEEFAGRGYERLWGTNDWPLTLSTPERAYLEMLDELPRHESFHQVDMIVEGLRTLSPRRLQKLLADCRSVKVKRLFFFFADRHGHAWLKQIDRDAIDLGTGKRMLVQGGQARPEIPDHRAGGPRCPCLKPTAPGRAADRRHAVRGGGRQISR